MSRLTNPCFCAFCKSPRKVYAKKHITTTNVVLAFLASVLLMLGLWQSFDPRVIVMFIAGLAISEFFVQIRWRLALVCPHCGFDPLLYLKKPDLAAQKVKTFYERRVNEPDFYLSGSPLLKLQRERQKKSRRIERGRHSQSVLQSLKASSSRSKARMLSKRL